MLQLVPLLLTTLLAAAASPAQDVPVRPPAPEFEDTLEEARAISRTDGRPVALYFTYQGCHWCRELESKTFSQPEVLAAMDRFIWAKIDRDSQPEVAKRFSVLAYPSILILGREDENVHRFSDFQPKLPFIASLEEGLERMERYKQGRDWLAPRPRPDSLLARAGVVPERTIPAPTNQLPGGLTFVDGKLFTIQGQRLYYRDEATGEYGFHQVPATLVDLCTDGRLLYAVSYGWTAGRPILIIDPRDGKVLHEIVTQENIGKKPWSALGIAYARDHLFVLSGTGAIYGVELETGEIRLIFQTNNTDMLGLDYDGERFVAGGHKGFYFMNGLSGQPERHVPTNYPVRSVAYHDGEYYAMEQPVFGYDEHHKRIQLWPKDPVIHAVNLKQPEPKEGTPRKLGGGR